MVLKDSDLKRALSPRERFNGLLLILFLALVICTWQLGSTGLVDETPPLFAAAGRAMAATGDWLTPRVNGLPRFDKPPLVYWLMGLGYSFPLQAELDPLGTWAARMPSALATVLMMLFLGDTVMRWPQGGDLYPRRTAVTVSLAFVLSPLVLLWGRTAVSDALLCGTLGVSLILQWRRYANPSKQSWWIAWVFLGLAVLTKGPVAVVLTGIVLVLFASLQGDVGGLWKKLCPLRGLVITGLISLPWYVAELIVEGKPFWDSFFGYHNLQRFTSVVNSHLQPWWFFGPVLVVASLPFTPFLILGLCRAFKPHLIRSSLRAPSPQESLLLFAACWLLAVLLFFTCAATKLPSYWLPATPASGLLIGLAAVPTSRPSRAVAFAWLGSVGLTVLIAGVLWGSSLWVPKIHDAEMPTLSEDLLRSGLLLRSAACFSIASLIGILVVIRPKYGRLLAMQGPIIAFQLLAFIPMWNLGDRIRHLPVRKAAKLMLAVQKPREPFAMVGAMKPSLHFYTNQVVVYEGRSEGALVNLSERLNQEQRMGWRGLPIEGKDGSRTVLVVIDQGTKKRRHWQDIESDQLGEFGNYLVLRVDRRFLEKRASQIKEKGIASDWRKPRPERF